jgi:alkylation response protein AidB-like acyl-CoA dehydrogenase
MSKTAISDRRNLDFLLYEFLRVQSWNAWPQFASHNREAFDQVIDLSHKLALERFRPHNQASDRQEPERQPDGTVKIIPEVGEALRAFAEAGFMAMLADEAEGGLQLPYTLALACDSLFMCANLSTSGYTLLSRGVANLLDAHGNEEQRRRYRDPIVQGRYTGTMCLSEPQAGSSLGDIKTMARQQADGSWRLEGAKMWISGGDHELSENIIHMVLAKTPDAPPGVKGISLFVVPRYRVNADGSRGPRNDVQLAGINHKLGQRGIVNTFLKFGENGDCYGELVGTLHQGLACMFHMMNEARLGVGMGAVMCGLAGYLYSLGYAQERRQGRPIDNKDPLSPPVPIIEHADVRRMLLQQKSLVEGAYALTLYAASLIDRKAHGVNEDGPALHARLELLTPIVKAWTADHCLRANDLAIQILGGYGYTREYPVEQYWRDNRLNPINEGTNGIQALDLLGRKAMMGGGAALRALLAEMQATAQAASADEALAEYASALQQGVQLAGETTLKLAAAMQQGNVKAALANAPQYLLLMGHLTVAWLWLQQAQLARAALPMARDADRDFYNGKLAACRYFFFYELPQIDVAAKLLQRMDVTALDVTVIAL